MRGSAGRGQPVSSLGCIITRGLCVKEDGSCRDAVELEDSLIFSVSLSLHNTQWFLFAYPSFLYLISSNIGQSIAVAILIVESSRAYMWCHNGEKNQWTAVQVGLVEIWRVTASHQSLRRGWSAHGAHILCRLL